MLSFRRYFSFLTWPTEFTITASLDIKWAASKLLTERDKMLLARLVANEQFDKAVEAVVECNLQGRGV